MPEEFKNAGFTLKTHQMFMLLRRNLKTITGHFGFVSEENSETRLGNIIIIVTSSFSKSSVFKMFSVRTKTTSRRFPIPPRVEERFRKAPFS